MSELKACPFCKSIPQANKWTIHGITETRYFCPNPDCPHSVRTVTLEQWNTRPLEDALLARAERAERMVERLIEAGWVIGSAFPLLRKTQTDIDTWDALVAEWQVNQKGDNNV